MDRSPLPWHGLQFRHGTSIFCRAGTVLTFDSPKAAGVWCIGPRCYVAKVLEIMGVTATGNQDSAKKKKKHVRVNALRCQLGHFIVRLTLTFVFTKMADEENKLWYEIPCDKQRCMAIVLNNPFSCSVLSSYFPQFFQTSIRFVFKLALATRFPFDGKSRFSRIFTGNFLEKIR